MSEKCQALFNTKYRWIGLTILVVWAGLLGVLTPILGVGTYFAIFIAIIVFNMFYTIDSCMTGKHLLFAVLPYTVPIAGFIIVILYSDPTTLQLMTVANPSEAQRATGDVSYVVENAYGLLAQGFFARGRQAPDISWVAFLPLYIVGWGIYAWSDASERSGLKGMATIAMISPIMIQFVLGFTYGRSYGLLGTFGQISELFGYLGSEIATPLIVIIGSLLDFVFVSVLFGIEHAIVEPESGGG